MCVKEKRSGNLFDMTFIYGNPVFAQRRWFWNKTEKLMPKDGGPWCCVGDFDEMNSICDKDGTRHVAPIRLSLFRDFLDSTSLTDLDLKGCRFIAN